MDLQLVLEKMIEAALEAEKVILDIYGTKFDVEIKNDDSPVTEADKKADALIREILGREFPSFAFLTEESKDSPDRLTKENVIIVDPVDGTKEFVSRNGEFTTNIALSHNHEIVAGLINAPTKDVLYFAIKGQGAYELDKKTGTRRKLKVNGKLDDLIVLRSRNHSNEQEEAAFLRHKGKIREVKVIGASLKFCQIAKGEAEVSYRYSDGTKEWDIAPGVLIVKEAGGFVLKPDGTEYSFNREDPYNREGYLIINRKENMLL